MKLTRSLMIVTLAGGSLWAQAPAKTPAATQAPAAKPAAAAAKPTAASATPAPAAKAAAAPAKVAPAPVAATKAPAAAPAKVAEKPNAVAAKTVEKKPAPKAETAEIVAKPASAKEETRVSSTAGKRDPFVSPLVRASNGPGPVCETGKRCLMIDQIMLKGIVKSPNGFIAVVENPMKRAYFLRENDPVFNGSVVKITGDAIIFREATTDKLGKQGTREVVKKVNAPVV